MVLGYHLIMTAYGFWLPNDPRGSWSDFVRSWELFRFGPATKVDSTRSVAGARHDVATRRAAKQALRYPEVHFTGIQARSVGNGFGTFAEKSGLRIWACSIMPEHMHMVVGRHRFKIEQVANLLKGASTRRLVADKLHPFAEFAREDGRVPRCWAAGEWKVFLDSIEDILRSIEYVNANPMKEGLPSQVGIWRFVQPFVPAEFV